MAQAQGKAPKTVWVVGAGASKSHSKGLFPTADGLLEHLLERYLRNEFHESETGLLALREYVLARFGCDLSERTDLPDLETTLCFIDGDLEVGHEPSLLLARTFLVRLVREALFALHRAQGTTEGDYHLQARSLTAADSVISFNWDVLLDDALGRQFLVSADKAPLYGKAATQYERFFLQFSGVGTGRIASLSPAPPTATATLSHGLLLKLHGSIDWLACANPLCTNNQLVFPVASEEARCASCLERLQPVLVPPVVAKRVREWAVLRRLWNRAAAEVSAATDIIVWGYSFPAVDFQSLWLLSHAQTGRVERITIINPVIAGNDPYMTGRHAAFCESVRRAFGGALRRCSISLYENYEVFLQKREAQWPGFQEDLISIMRGDAV